MDLSLVRLARSHPPTAEALRAALQRQDWLSPDPTRRGTWARTFGFAGGLIQIAPKPGEDTRHAAPGLVAKLLPDADFAVLAPRFLALAAELHLGFDVPGSGGALWWPAPDPASLPPGTLDRAVAASHGCDAREAWPLLGFTLAGPECLELAESHPVLAALLANTARVDRRYRVDLPADERGPFLRALACRPRREILGALDFPPAESLVRLLGKVPARRLHLESVRLLRDLRLAPHAAKALRHLPRFGSSILPIAVRRGLWPHVGPQLLHEVAEDDDGSVYFRLRDTVEMAEALGRIGEIGIVPSRAALDALHDRLQQEHEARAQRNLREARRREEALAREAAHRASLVVLDGAPRPAPVPAPLPRRPPEPPPAPLLQPPSSPPGIVRLLTRAELRAEGREMGHCVASYGRKVEGGEYAVYRVLAPERATLGLRFSRARGLWGIDQIRGHANVGVRCETRLYLRDWIETGVVDPAAARWALAHARRQHRKTRARLEDAIDEADRAEIRRALARLRIGELPRASVSGRNEDGRQQLRWT
jgi:hypothetical protein